MKQSNLALRGEFERLDFEAAEIAAPAPDIPGTGIGAPPSSGLRLARTRAMGMNYRAIAIGDDGLRLFRVR